MVLGRYVIKPAQRAVAVEILLPVACGTLLIRQDAQAALGQLLGQVMAVHDAQSAQPHKGYGF
ncbi:hypothetical protein SDC9_166899 [bioreactor metagenome]|uniref:Uncharacterized protein n=1 Tax=bioreactor metagenome TaxID=1076179 RepID=A0A645FYA1_9ZZZZ